MSTYRFELQHVDRAFSGKIPESLWARASRHTTLSAARKAIQKAGQEMKRICGPSAWNGHNRIIALVDTPMKAESFCLGAINPHGQTEHSPACQRHTEVAYVWPAGQPQPEPPLAWTNCCPACRKIEEEG